MKKITSVFIAASLLLISVSVNAQIPVEKIQKLMDKAAGQKFMSLMGNDQKLTKQVITADTYTISYTESGKHGSKWVEQTSNIKWGSGFKHFSTTENSNDKLTRFVFHYENKDMPFDMHVEGKPNNGLSTTYALEFYVLTKDADEMSALIKDK
jgi:hypothetical protein